MALRNVRTSKTTTRKTEVIVKSVKQTPKKTPERIAKEAKYNADLEVYNQSKADQSSAESEYSSSMGKYNENMKKYNENVIETKAGPLFPSMYGVDLNKEQLARFNAKNQKDSPGNISSSRIRLMKGADTEAFTKYIESDKATQGGGWFLQEYVKPKAPEKRKTTSVSEPVQDWEEEILPMKITSVSTKKQKLIPAKEDVTWNAPDLDKRKKASYMRGTKITPSRVTATGRRVDTKIGIDNAAIRKQSDAVSPQRIKYNTEQRRSAAYYGDNTSTGEKITGKTESELRQLKKETRGEFGRVLKEGRLGDALTIGKDLSQIRRATRYTKDADLSVGSTGVTVEGEGSNLRYFTPEKTKKVTQDGRQVRGEGAMAGYKEFQAQEKGKVFRAQYENATNRNTIANQQATNAAAATPTSSFSSSVVTRGQMKDKFKTDNPTATPRQVRQGVREEIKTNRQIQIDLRKKEQEKGMY